METRHREIIQLNIEDLIRKTNCHEELLDKLAEKGVFPNVMVEEIKNKDGPDGLKRELYERVQRRGPKAYYKLLEALKECDLNELVQLLEDRTTEEPSRPDFTIMEAFTRMDIDHNNVYLMGSRPKGYVLLINNYKFYDENATRLGSGRDVANLEHLWKQLGYEVIIKSNLSGNEFRATVAAFSQRDFSSVDSAVVFIMTHGIARKDQREVLFYGIDNEHVSSDWVLERFTKSNCPTLYMKPKLFFFNTCRGSRPDVSYLQVDGAVTLPKLEFQDMIVIYPCSPGRTAERSLLHGTVFVQKLVDVFRVHARNTDLESMLDLVTQEVKQHRNNLAGVQIVNVELLNFKKRLYFHPHLYDSS